MTRRYLECCALVVIALSALPVTGRAAPPAPTSAQEWATGREPLQVDSDRLEVLGNESRVVFEGDVTARQGDLTLRADRVEVLLEADTREIRSVQARGDVRIEKQDTVATGREASYDAAAGVVVLTGEPKVWRGRDVVTGEVIRLFLAENRSEVEGANAVLFPGKPQQVPEKP